MSDIHPQQPTTAVGSDPFPAVSQRRRRGVQVTSAAAIALGLVLAGSAAAGATTPSTASKPVPSATSGHQPFDGARPAAVGTVKSVGDGMFTVTTQGGTTVTVAVDGSTTYFDPGVSSPSSGSVAVGQQVAVFGSEASDSVAATRVAIGLPPSGGPGGPGSGPAPGQGPGGGPGGKPERGPSKDSAGRAGPTG
jgi:hypothetical protein